MPNGTSTEATTRSMTRGPGSSSTRMTDPAMTPGTVPAMSIRARRPRSREGQHVVARKIGYRWHHPPRLTAERDMFAITGLPPLLARAPAAPGSMYADLRTSNPRHPSRRGLGFSHCRSADSELRQ
jgi:hypothetical protein